MLDNDMTVPIFDAAQKAGDNITVLFQRRQFDLLYQAITCWCVFQEKIFMQAFMMGKPLNDLTHPTYLSLIETDPFASLLHINVKISSRAPLPTANVPVWIKDAFQDLNQSLLWPSGFSVNAKYGLMGLVGDGSLGYITGWNRWKIYHAAFLFLKSHLFENGHPENGKLAVPLFGLPDLDCYHYWHRTLCLIRDAMCSCMHDKYTINDNNRYFSVKKPAVTMSLHRVYCSIK